MGQHRPCDAPMEALILHYLRVYVVQSHDYISERSCPMYMLNGWWFLSSSGSYPLVFTVVHTIEIDW